MNKKFKSAIALFMALAMVMGLCAGTAFASVGDPDAGGDQDAIVVGSNGNEANAPRYAEYVNESVDGITITDDVSWHNGLIYYGGDDYDTAAAEYTVSNVTIIMDTDADGSDTSDFGGLGAAIAAIGNGVVLTVEDSYIETTGVAKLALYTDDGAVSIVKNSTLISNGGVLYDGFYSTADTTMMVSPPWVLGLGGDETEGVNARTTNIMGTNSVGVYIDSYFYASGWGALSTDNGSGNTMVVINTYVEVENSGYGAYTIGETTEEYYGSTMDVSTYAIIMTGGEATFQSYTAGQEIAVYKQDGGTDDYGIYSEGTQVYTASSEAVTEGTVYSSIVSENFGFMCHSNGTTGYNIINILDGTTVSTEDAVVLIKKINAVVNIDDATIESGNGVLLQIIDNDDDYIGVDSTLEWGFDDSYGHSYGTHMPSFNQVFEEEDGYSNEWMVNEYGLAGDSSSNWTAELNITNATIDGDVWNSTGYVGSNPATTLTVNLGEGAVLTGLISAGAFSHTTKYATVGDGDWSGASALGHVTNIVYSNGANLVNVTLTDGAVWYVDADSYIDSLSVDETSSVVVADGVTLTVGDETYTGETIGAEVSEDLGAADTADEDVSAIVVGSNGNEANAPKYASYINESVDGISLSDDVSWHNGLIFYGGDGYDNEGGVYYVTNSEIIMDTDADGSDTSDFGGLGAAVAAIGNGITLYIENTTIETTGVAKLALYTDDGAVSIVKNSSLISNGGVIYEGFYSTADTTMMVSPPWVLGLGGDETEGVNARTTNIMGTNSVGVYIDSYFQASGWGALSTDNGSANTMIVINTKVVVENSGYGAYTIGETTEEYYGSTMDVSTYAIIMTGGEATFQSYTAGQEVEVYKMDGDADEYGINTEGTLVTTVTSDAVTEGTVYSEIVSDNFGFMCHSNGSTGYNIINILDGTSVTATDAIFLIKKINAVITVDDATLESTEKGVILQIIDNDDDYIGVDATLEWGFDDEYGHSYGTHMPSFNQTFSEEDGYSNEWIADTAAAATEGYSTDDNWTVDYTMTNTTVDGDIWNSSGYVGSNAATTLNVTLGEGASLTGIISAGAFSHDTKYAEVGDGDWSGASALGHVTNIVYSNGVNLVNVTLTDDAAWTVDSESYIDTLTVSGDAVVTIADGATLTVGDTVYEAGTITSSGYTEATEESSDSTSPTTGDSSNMALWMAIAVLAICCGGVLVLRRRFN